MAAINIVTVSGMFGGNKTYFADSPVVIDISGLAFPASSPFKVVRVEVVDGNGNIHGEFRADTGGQSSISFDISSALRAMWADEVFGDEVKAANDTITNNEIESSTRDMLTYSLQIYTEYIAIDGVFTRTVCKDSESGSTIISGGQCLIGGMTELERSRIGNKANADVSHFEHTGLRNGDASTKPTSSPERVGIDSITSWVDVGEENKNNGGKRGITKSIFYPATTDPSVDDPADADAQGTTYYQGHAPIVLRDSVPYTDFLFVNRRGAVETCSGQTLEAMSIDVNSVQYSRVERPSFIPVRSLMAVNGGGRRSWSMSSGFVTREWAEWWTMEFLMARQWWMLYEGSYVPVVVKPAKQQTDIYNRSKQQMPHVDFTVTLALEG